VPVAMRLFRPIAAARQRYLQLPTCFSNGDRGNPIFRRECAQSVAPNVFVELVSIPELRSQRGASHVHVHSAKPISVENAEVRSVVDMFCLSWKWRKRSSVKIMERTYEERAQALHC
jgi:hypothetical protein